MKWSEEADDAIKKKVKKKAGAFAGQKGKTSVELSDVMELKKSQGLQACQISSILRNDSQHNVTTVIYYQLLGLNRVLPCH